MAGTIQLRPPKAFDFRKPDEWLKWQKRFEQFQITSGLSAEDETRQVSTLLYCMGEEAKDVLTSTNITSDKKKKHGTVNEYFKVHKNVIFERARFNHRSQIKGESVEQYITTLYRLSETCEYGNLTSKMIRDRLVVGIQDSTLSERLQMDPNLTLEKAKKMVCQNEAVHEHQVILKQPETTDKFLVIKQIRRKTPKNTSHPPSKSASQAQQMKCKRCRNKPHSLNKCPPKEATCHKCKRKGHYSSQCFSKTVHEVTELIDNQLAEDLDVTYLNTIDSENNSC